MDLNVSTGTGSYFYEQRGGGTLWVSGTNQTGLLLLNETTSQDRPTGRFELRWTEPRLTGDWISTDGRRRLPVTLNAVARFLEAEDYFPEVNTRATRVWPRFLDRRNLFLQQVSRDAEKDLLDAVSEFKELGRETFAEYRKENKDPEDRPARMYALNTQITIGACSSNYVGLLRIRNEFWGMADYPEYAPMNYVIRNGRMQTLALNQVLPGPRWPETLGTLLLQDLRRQKADFVLDRSVSAFRRDELLRLAWVSRPTGLIFFFQPGDVAAPDRYVESVLPYSQLERAGVLKDKASLRELGLPIQ